jgi:K(+)-stimulated pyrophosphate-energized sodium pump
MAPPTITTPAPAPVAAPVAPVPAAQLFFELDKFDPPADTTAKLAPIVAYLKANAGARAIISGYHDPSGNRAANEELAKNRAKAAREALKAAGIAEERVVMEKPLETTGTGTNEQARRVDVGVLP